MGDRETDTCLHGMTVSSCLICQTLEPDRRRGRQAEGAAPMAVGRRGVSGRGILVGLVVVGVLLVLVTSWLVALAWTVLRAVQLVVVAVVAGWVGWRLGVRHGRRHPR